MISLPLLLKSLNGGPHSGWGCKQSLAILDISRISLILIVIEIMLLGCGKTPVYREEYQLTNLQVVFLDQESLHQEWTTRTGERGVKFSAYRSMDSLPTVKTLHGFFDFTTNTLYCPKWNFEVCGHELHHAILGHFHDPQ